MPIEFSWTLPAPQPHAPGPGPAAWIDQATAAEYAGFQTLVASSTPNHPDAWMVASVLARHTRSLRLLVALRPGLVHAAAAAQAAATLQRLAGQRLALSVATGQANGHRAYGDLLDHDDRFARAAEYLHVLQQLWKGRSGSSGFSFEGRHLRVEGGGLLRPLREVPPFYIGGSTPGAERLAAQFAQVHYQWGDEAEAVSARIRRIRDAAALQHRSLRFGCRLHVIARASEDAALLEAGQLWASRPRTGAPAEGAGKPVAPNLWTGVPLPTAGSSSDPLAVPTGTLVAGSYAQVAAALDALHETGVESFLLSADEGVDGVLRVGEEVLPRVRQRSAAPDPAAKPAVRTGGAR